MPRPSTRPCDDYSEADLLALGEHIARVVAATGDAPHQIRAQVEYHGTIARQNGGVRTFTLDQLSQARRRDIVASVGILAAAQAVAEDARPLASYNRQGWRARFRQLTRTARGREALEQAGASTNRRTRAAWLLGGNASKANQNAINRAYQDIRMGPVRAAEEARDDALREVAETFDDAVADAYGSNGVRFRDIQG